MAPPPFQTGVANHDSSNQRILSTLQTTHARREQKRSVTPQLQTVSFSSGHYHHHTPVVRNPALPFAAGSRHQASEINQQALLQHIAGQSSSQVSFSMSTQVTNSTLPAISRKLSASRASSTDSAHTLQFVQSGEETNSSAGAPSSFFRGLFQPGRNPGLTQNNVFFAAPKGSTSKTTRLTPYHRTNSINVNHSQSNQLQPASSQVGELNPLPIYREDIKALMEYYKSEKNKGASPPPDIIELVQNIMDPRRKEYLTLTDLSKITQIPTSILFGWTDTLTADSEEAVQKLSQNELNILWVQGIAKSNPQAALIAQKAMEIAKKAMEEDRTNKIQSDNLKLLATILYYNYGSIVAAKKLGISRSNFRIWKELFEPEYYQVNLYLNHQIKTEQEIQIFIKQIIEGTHGNETVLSKRLWIIFKELPRKTQEKIATTRVEGKEPLLFKQMRNHYCFPSSQ